MRCRLAYAPADATATHSLASVKSRLVLPFWYQLTWVVPERGRQTGVCVLYAKIITQRHFKELCRCRNSEIIERLPVLAAMDGDAKLAEMLHRQKAIR